MAYQTTRCHNVQDHYIKRRRHDDFKWYTPTPKKYIFRQNKKQTTAVTTDAKGRLRNGGDMIMKYGTIADYFVIKQIHWRVANG